ncbi:hypothetical protein JHK85_006898 [Glycine max]|nr:hypothetical protein JHK85_006898 [Glycine max]KAG5071489.1 hypothetical protein JHK86_006700 [Glycine max]
MEDETSSCCKLFKKPCSNNIEAVGRSVGFLIKQSLRKSLPSADNVSEVLNPPLQQPRDQDQQAWLPAVSPPPLPACAVATTGMHRRRLDNRNSSTSTVIRGGDSNMLRFYTDDAPGLKISPTMVLVMSFCFIGFTTLHVFDKLYRSKSGGVV